MPDLVIRFKKKTDGSAALSCTRADGTVTWQRQEGLLGTFFPLHDLTHLAVESVLGLRRAFYGLLSEGWDITAFGKADRPEGLPQEALFTELIVGYFDLERRSATVLPAEEFNEKIRTFLADKKLPPALFELTQPQVDEIRSVRDAYFAKWRALPAGETMELIFNRAPSGTAAAGRGDRPGDTNHAAHRRITHGRRISTD
jgi:hypothetical protein